MEARMQQMIEKQDSRFQEMFSHMMQMIQQNSPNVNGAVGPWTMNAHQPPDVPMVPENEDPFDRAARELGITREEALQLNDQHMQILAEEQMSCGPNQRL